LLNETPRGKQKSISWQATGNLTLASD